MYPIIAEDVLFIEESDFVFAVRPRQEAMRLNHAAAQIWKLCNGKHSLIDITAQIAAQNNLENKKAATVVIPFIRDMNEEGYILFSSQPLGTSSPSSRALDWFSTEIDRFLNDAMGAGIEKT